MAAVVFRGIGNGCNCLGNTVCEPLFTFSRKICTSPLGMFVVVVVVTNVPPIMYGILTAVIIFGHGSECRRAWIWLIANAALCACHIAASVYIVKRIQNETDPRLSEKYTTISRASHLLCYDGIVAIYIVLFVIYLLWMTTGTVWRSTNQDACQDDVILSFFTKAIAFDYAFVDFGAIAFALSLCVACCDGRRYSNQSSTESSNYQSANENMDCDTHRDPPYNPNTSLTITASHISYNPPHSSGPHLSHDIEQNTNKGNVNARDWPSNNQTQDVANIPMAVATPIVPIDHGHYESNYNQPSAPPLPSSDSLEHDAAAVASGSALGYKVGKLFGVTNPQTQASLENKGVKVNLALHNAKKYLHGKTSKPNK